MALRYREKADNAIEMKKDFPSQVVLGQLPGTALASFARRAPPILDQLRGLLLDDPPQHYGIIHTVAFVDALLNTV